MNNHSGTLIIVSNRLPITVEKAINNKLKITKSSGGLVAGLDEIHHQTNALWLGHSGIYPADQEYSTLKTQLTKDRLICVDLNEQTYNAYYNGFCNSIIWPLFHYFTEAACATSSEWLAYQEVNKQFAETILSIVKPGDRVWVHDYQLMLLPGLLRAAHPKLSIAYFHHIPFPAADIFRTLPSRTQILEGLLGADLIGFHTHSYAQHFLSSFNLILKKNAITHQISHKNRRIHLIDQPLGVDVKMIQTQKYSLLPQNKNTSSSKPSSKTIILGLDRLDYTKGIPERLLAFQKFLRTYPQYIGKISFVQICVPSRILIKSYRNLRTKVERLVNKINQEFSALGYTPIEYHYRSFNKEEIIYFYKQAQIAMVTPLRDGLNLVCKEYVAAHDDEDGVLILSELAGAAEELKDALLVNPYDIDQMVSALYAAINMSALERQKHMCQLRKKVIFSDNLQWLQEYLQKWNDIDTSKAYYHLMPSHSDMPHNTTENVSATLSTKSQLTTINPLNTTFHPINNTRSY